MADNSFSYEDAVGAAPGPQGMVHEGSDPAASGWRPIQDPQTGHVIGYLPPVGPQDQAGGVAAPTTPPQAAPAAPAAPAPQPQMQAPAPQPQTPAAPAAAGQGFSYEDAQQGVGPGGDARPTSQGLGFMESLMKPLDNAATWANKILPDDAIAHALGLPSTTEANAARQAAFKTAEQNAKPGGWGQAGGTILSSLPVMFAAPEAKIAQGLSKLPMVGAAAARLAPQIATAVQGGLTGALNTDDPNNPRQVGLDTILGSAGALTGDAALQTVGKALSPVVKPAVQKLLDAGVRLTPGQMMGGAAKTFEDTLTSIPIVKDMVNSAQRRSMEDFNLATGNDALAHIGEKIPATVKAGRQMVDHIQARLGGAYEALAPQMRAAIDGPFAQAVAAARAKIAPTALDELHTFDQIVRDEVLQRGVKPQVATGTGMVPYGVTAPGAGPVPSYMDGRATKAAQEAIGAKMAGMHAGDPKTRSVVEGLGMVQDALNDSLDRNSPPGVKDRLGDINAAYAKFKRIQSASASMSDREGGIFTPYRFGQAIKKGDVSKDKGNFAAGRGLMQDLSSAAEQVLPSTVPDSGTALRYITSELPMLLGFGSESAHYLPQIGQLALGVGALGAPYTNWGSRVAQKVIPGLARNAPATRAVISAARPAVAVTSGAAGRNLAAQQLPQRTR